MSPLRAVNPEGCAEEADKTRFLILGENTPGLEFRGNEQHLTRMVVLESEFPLSLPGVPVVQLIRVAYGEVEISGPEGVEVLDQNNQGPFPVNVLTDDVKICAVSPKAVVVIECLPVDEDEFDGPDDDGGEEIFEVETFDDGAEDVVDTTRKKIDKAV